MGRAALGLGAPTVVLGRHVVLLALDFRRRGLPLGLEGLAVVGLRLVLGLACALRPILGTRFGLLLPCKALRLPCRLFFFPGAFAGFARVLCRLHVRSHLLLCRFQCGRGGGFLGREGLPIGLGLSSRFLGPGRCFFCTCGSVRGARSFFLRSPRGRLGLPCGLLFRGTGVGFGLLRRLGRGLFFRQRSCFSLCVGVQRRFRAVHACGGRLVARNERQGFLVLVVRVFPSAAGLGPLAVFHGVVVPHPGTRQILFQVGHPVQLVGHFATHVVGVTQVKFNPRAALVERGDADGRVQQRFVKALNVREERHVQVEGESVVQLARGHRRAVDLNPLGHHVRRTEFNHVVAAQGHIEEILAVAVHVNLIKGLSILEHRHRDVVHFVPGVLVPQGAADDQRLAPRPHRQPTSQKQPENRDAQRVRRKGCAVHGRCRVGLHRARSA